MMFDYLSYLLLVAVVERPFEAAVDTLAVEVPVVPVLGEEVARVVRDVRVLLQERRKLGVGLQIAVVIEQRRVHLEDPRQGGGILLQDRFEGPTHLVGVHLNCG